MRRACVTRRLTEQAWLNAEGQHAILQSTLATDKLNVAAALKLASGLQVCCCFCERRHCRAAPSTEALSPAAGHGQRRHAARERPAGKRDERAAGDRGGGGHDKPGARAGAADHDNAAAGDGGSLFAVSSLSHARAPSNTRAQQPAPLSTADGGLHPPSLAARDAYEQLSLAGPVAGRWSLERLEALRAGGRLESPPLPAPSISINLVPSTPHHVLPTCIHSIFIAMR